MPDEKSIDKREKEMNKMSISEFLSQDRFYLDLENDKIEWMYYNPDSNSGGQFVINAFDLALLKEAVEGKMEAEAAFHHIENGCRQFLSDHGTEFYGEAWKRMQTSEPFAIGCTLTTLDRLRTVYEARDLINDYCLEEFGSSANFSDLSAIGIGYTTITDAEHPVQAYANLVDHRIEIYLYDRMAEYRQFDSLEDMVKNGLSNLNFDDLIYLPDWIIADFEHHEGLQDLAVRLTFFMKNHEPEGYAQAMGTEETDADMVAKIRFDLRDIECMYQTLTVLEAIVKEGTLSEQDKAKCYDMMTDLYHLYADEMFVPVYDRETDILYKALDGLGLEGYVLCFDSEGICMTKDGAEWHNDAIYRYLANKVSIDALRQFCNEDFKGYTDFKDLAKHYDVRIGSKRRTPPVARLDFLGCNGIVGDSVEYQTETDFLDALKEQLYYGVPLVVVLYRDEEGKTISRNFLKDLDTMPKGLKVEDAPAAQLFKKQTDRSDAR